MLRCTELGDGAADGALDGERPGRVHERYPAPRAPAPPQVSSVPSLQLEFIKEDSPFSLQGYLTHKKQPPPLGPSQGPR